MFGTYLIPDAERDAGHEANRYRGRQLERRNVERVDTRCGSPRRPGGRSPPGPGTQDRARHRLPVSLDERLTVPAWALAHCGLLARGHHPVREAPDERHRLPNVICVTFCEPHRGTYLERLIPSTPVTHIQRFRRSAQRFELDTYHGDALPSELRGPVFGCLTCGFWPADRLSGSCTAVTQHSRGRRSLHQPRRA